MNPKFSWFLLTMPFALLACSSEGSRASANGSTSGPGAGGGAAANGGSAMSSGGAGGTASGGGGAAGTPSVEPGTPLSFTVDVSMGAHAISPYIYCQSAGSSSLDSVKALAQTNGLHLVRAGGNRFSAYNWETNASNAGADYQFQNDAFLSDSDVPGAAIEGLLTASDQGITDALVTGQLGDYVAADKKGDGDVTQTADYLATRFKKNVVSKGSALDAMPVTTDDSVYQDEYLGWVKSAHPKAKVLVSLDNEPDLWSSTHKEIWPMAPAYDAFIQRNIDYAKMVRRAFPSAEVVGLASFGWYGWRTFTGTYKGGDFLDHYLDQVKAAETSEGMRLIDYVDFHWYPEARGVAADASTRVINQGTSEAEVAARLQAPRSLWDPSYVETSWISDNLKTEEPASQGAIALIPRLKKQLAAHDPGTKLAFGEWNYGAGAHVSGGLATADVLGIFGRESVDLACNWAADPEAVFRDGAYQLYGNYDGKGSRFGDTSVSASAGDTVLSSVYAATDKASPERLTLVLINKDSAPHLAKVSIKASALYKSAQVYVLDAEALDSYNKTAHPQAAASVTTTTPNELSVPLPAQSAILLVPSTAATAPQGDAWPAPAVVTEKGWTFDKDTEGWALGTLAPADLGPTLTWNSSEGKPKAGALALQVPFSAREQQAQILIANQSLDLTGKKLQVNVRREGAFDGGVMLFAGSAKDTSWVAHGWTLLSSTDWTTIVLDPVAAETNNADFDPKAVTYLGVQFGTGDAGNTTPSPVTFYVDQAVVVSTQ
jgi:hypothetical protein